MASELYIQLLGAPHVTLHNVPLRFKRRKALALLAYLAVTGLPHTRDTLATLLADETSDQLARQQLRNALHALSAQLGAYLQVTPQSLALPSSAVVVVDVASFTVGVSAALAAKDAIGLAQAINVYSGELLAGFTLRNAPGFEEWLLLERERLRLLLLDALQHLVMLHTQRGALAGAIAAARQLLALEPCQEQNHRQLMELFVQDGQIDLALAQYAECQRVLASELGVSPSPAARAFYEQLRTPAGIPPHNLPVPQLTFVGRSNELAWLRQHLADPDCRVVSVVGLGGSGKTSLALAAATDYIQPGRVVLPAPFPDGIYLVDFATGGAQSFQAEPGAMAAQRIAATIATTLGLVLHGTGDLLRELKYALQHQRLLLLLDNAEDLVVGAAYLAELVAHAPSLKLLVTSRTPLQIQPEHLLDLQGLPVPTTTGALETTAASQLFLAQAQRLRAELVLTPVEREALVQLCQLLQGLPLALVLAASWTRTLRINELVTELSQSLDLLSTSLRDLPLRQQSIRTVLNWAWQQLSPNLRSILSQASVFCGGYTDAAARAVLQAGRIQLHTLCDSGLINRDALGRYRLHELVRQYGAEQLADNPAAATQLRSRHAAYYAGLAADIALDQHPQREALEQVAAEYANVEAAWVWAVAAGRTDLLSQLQPTLSSWLDLKGRFQTGCDLLGSAVAQIRQRSITALEAHDARVIMDLAHFHARLGRFQRARSLLYEVLAIAQACAEYALTARVYYYFGLFEFYQGAPAHALQTQSEALELAKRASAKQLQVEILRALGQIEAATTNYTQAEAWLGHALSQASQLGMQRLIAVILADQGDLAFYALDYAVARDRQEESLKVSRALDDNTVIPHNLASLGRIAAAQGDFALARAYFTAGLELSRKTGNISAQAKCLQGIGTTATQQNDALAARPFLEENIQLMRLVGNKEGLAHALMALANTYYETSDPQRYQPLFAEALSLMRAVHNFRGIASVLNNMGMAALNCGDYVQAASLLEESRAINHMVGSPSGVAFALNNLGLLALQMGEVSLAKARFAESAAIRLRLGEAWALAYSLAGLAATELAAPLDAARGGLLKLEQQRQAATMAARLIGATEQLLAQVQSRLSSIYAAIVAETVARARAILGPDAFGAAYAEGQAMTPEALLQG